MATRRLGGIATSSSVPDNGGDHSGGGGGSGGGYVDDVFSTYLYEGTNAPQDIVNGIDLAGKGGMAWFKRRSGGATTGHAIHDTERDIDKRLVTNTADAEIESPDIASFNSDGISIVNYSSWVNGKYAGDNDYVSWTFRKAPSFFDVVTYTGDRVNGREIPHNLGSVPGMIIVKALTRSSNWSVLHKDAGLMYLNDPNAAYGEADTSKNFGDGTNRIDPTSTEFTVGQSPNVNQTGDEYVAYLFAHDDSDESLIKCGSYTGTGATQEIDLGWEPQWVMIKTTTATQGWLMYETMRGLSSTDSAYLYADKSDQEMQTGFSVLSMNATGFTINSTGASTNQGGQEYIYMAIRRPNKPAEEFEPEELFTCVESTSDAPVYRTSPEWPVDFSLFRYVLSNRDTSAASRLTGPSYLQTNQANAEESLSAGDWDYMNGWRSSIPGPQNAWMWRRAPHFFDVVCYEGDGQEVHEIPHNLGVNPEMIWVKARDQTHPWPVYHKDTHTTNTSQNWRLDLSTDGARNGGSSYFPFATLPDSFPVGSANYVNKVGVNYIAYLFASVPGISKVGSYTGNGAEYQAIYPDGFSGQGVNFVLIKRTDGNGNWIVVDRKQSLDGAIALNRADTQKAGKFWSWTMSGFLVYNIETHGPEWNPNIAGAEYIYYAITR